MWNNRKRNSISSHKAKLKWSSRSFGDVFGSFSLISIKVCLRFFEGWNIPQMGLSKARLFRKGTYGGGHVELPKDLTRFWSGWLWNPRSSTILVNSSMVSGGCSLAYLWRSDLVYGSAISTRSLWQVYGTCRTFSDVAFWRLLLQNLRSFLWASAVASMMTFTGDDPHWPHWNPFSKSIVEHNNSRNPYQANLKCAYEKVFWNRRSFDLSWLSLRDKKLITYFL